MLIGDFDPLRYLDIVEKLAYRQVELTFNLAQTLFIETVGGSRGKALDSVDMIRLTAGHVGPDVALGLLDMFPNAVIGNFYGSNEALPAWSCRVYTKKELQGIGERLAIGRGPSWAQLGVLGKDNGEAAIGEVGELSFRLARGIEPRRVQGEGDHWDSRRATMIGMGDLGMIDADGDCYVLARRLDTVERGTRRVLVADVQDALERHDRVQESVVVGIPDRMLGEEVAAIVVGDHVDVEELRLFCAQYIDRFMIPRVIRVVESIPRKRTRKGDAVVDHDAVMGLVLEEASKERGA